MYTEIKKFGTVRSHLTAAAYTRRKSKIICNVFPFIQRLVCTDISISIGHARYLQNGSYYLYTRIIRMHYLNLLNKSRLGIGFLASRGLKMQCWCVLCTAAMAICPCHSFFFSVHLGAIKTKNNKRTNEGKKLPTFVAGSSNSTFWAVSSPTPDHFLCLISFGRSCFSHFDARMHFYLIPIHTWYNREICWLEYKKGNLNTCATYTIHHITSHQESEN